MSGEKRIGAARSRIINGIVKLFGNACGWFASGGYDCSVPHRTTGQYRQITEDSAMEVAMRMAVDATQQPKATNCYDISAGSAPIHA
jgi:hypothetical protein